MEKEKSQEQNILSLALKYRYEERHAQFVRTCALKIFDALESIHKLGAKERLILEHAALLHDIGSFVSGRKHHKHTKFLIENDELLEKYPRKSKEMLSLITFSHRKKEHPDIYLLSKREREAVRKLSAILRAADALDYTREEVAIKGVRVIESILEIQIEGVKPEALDDRLARKKQLFREIFNMDIKLVGT
ncbi:MAG: HD domain-containing protein [Clostridia bacterium]|nr:HD domain-containing protein [Clostridia bacterium]